MTDDRIGVLIRFPPALKERLDLEAAARSKERQALVLQAVEEMLDRGGGAAPAAGGGGASPGFRSVPGLGGRVKKPASKVAAAKSGRVIGFDPQTGEEIYG